MNSIKSNNSLGIPKQNVGFKEFGRNIEMNIAFVVR